MLINYVYDYHFQKKPVACVVCTAPGKVGVSVCNEKDQFNKKLARQIALGRATTGHKTSFPNRELIDFNFDVQYLGDMVNSQVHRMEERAKRYFKNA